jgi:hypothetical protein
LNIQVSNVLAPTPPKNMAETGLGQVMMRDIFLKTMFRMNLDLISDLSRIIAMPVPVA